MAKSSLPKGDRPPTVDIIVPCYNYGRYLNSCVQSVLSQTDVQVRVIVIDDQSSDNTGEVGRELARGDSRVEFHRHEVNRGHIATYNEGLEMAHADYVVLLSADDMLTPGALARATELMESHPNVGFVYGHPISLHGCTVPPARTRCSGWSVWPGIDWVQRMCRSGRNFITSPEVVMRRSVQQSIGGYRPSLPHSGDMEMWMRAASVSDVGRVNGVDQAYYRVHGASMQRTTYSGVLRDLEGRLQAITSALQQTTDRVPDAAALLAQARESLALDAVRHARVACWKGAGEAEPLDDYFAFARATWPGVIERSAWRAAHRIRSGPPSLLGGLLQRTSARADYWRRYWAWCRWWRTGVY